MARHARVFDILIASPSDVAEERRVLREVMHEWNEAHGVQRGCILQPVMWETSTVPEFGDRPQALINGQIVDRCDAAVAVFWTRVGSPTGVAESGTVEEFERFRSAKKPVFVYFSSRSVRPDAFDAEQYAAVTSFKDRIRRDGLTYDYGTPDELRVLFARHLSGIVDRFLLKEAESAEAADEQTDDAGNLSALRGPYSLTFNEKPQIEKMHRDQGGTVVQHDYLLTVTLRNEGTKTVRSWHIDVELPTLLLAPGVVYGSRVGDRSDPEVTLLRMTDEARPAGIRPGDDVRMTLLYRVDNKVYYEHQEVFSKPVTATAYVDDDLVAKHSQPVEKLTNF